MQNVLIVSGSEKSLEALRSIVETAGIKNPAEAVGSLNARRALANGEYDYIFINTPLPDEFGQELALIAAESLATVCMLVKESIADEVFASVSKSGIYVIPKPVTRASVYQAIRFMEAARCKISALAEQNKKLILKNEEMRVVNRAKCALMECLDMCEADAHRYIEKLAMDTRRPKLSVSKDILEKYSD